MGEVIERLADGIVAGIALGVLLWEVILPAWVSLRHPRDD